MHEFLTTGGRYIRYVRTEGSWAAQLMQEDREIRKTTFLHQETGRRKDVAKRKLIAELNAALNS